MRAWLIVVGWAGCTTEGAPPPVAPAADARAVEEGTPDALGVLAMLDDPATTVTALDIDAALDARAATNLIAHRDGPDGRFGTGDDDRFDSIAEVDGVSYVGDAALGRLVDYARSRGYVIEDAGVYGVVEGVALSVDDAAAALRVANGANYDVLDVDVGLDARAAAGIVDARPFGTIEDVAAVPYVGRAALEDLVAYGLVADVHLDAEGAVTALEIASAGLWFSSESDYPVDVWVVGSDGTPLTEATAKEALADAYVARAGEPGLDDRDVELTDLGAFFDRYTVEQAWWDDERRAQQPRWQALRDVFERQLGDAQVVRFGVRSGGVLSGAIDVFVVGRTADGAWAGVRTVSVET